MHFRDDARTAQRAADESGIVPHALVRLLRSEDCLVVDESNAHLIADYDRFFTREGENVGQEGLDALVHRVSTGIPDRPWRLRQGGLQLAAAPPATSHEKRTSGVR